MPMYREYRCELCGRPFVVKDVVLSGRITCDDTPTHQRLAELTRDQTVDSEATNTEL